MKIGCTPGHVNPARMKLARIGALLIGDDMCGYDVVCGTVRSTRAALRKYERARTTRAAVEEPTAETRQLEQRLYYVVLGSAVNDSRAAKPLPRRRSGA